MVLTSDETNGGSQEISCRPRMEKNPRYSTVRKHYFRFSCVNDYEISLHLDFKIQWHSKSKSDK